MSLLHDTPEGPKTPVDYQIYQLGKDRVKSIIIALPEILDAINQEQQLSGGEQIKNLYQLYLEQSGLSVETLPWMVFRQILLDEIIGVTTYLVELNKFIVEEYTPGRGHTRRFVTTDQSPYTNT